MNEEFKVKLTPKDDSPAYSQKPSSTKQPKGGHTSGTSNAPQIWNYNDSTIFEIRQPNIRAKEPKWETATLGWLEKNQQPSFRWLYKMIITQSSTLVDAAQHMAGKKLFCELDCFTGVSLLPDGWPGIYWNVSLQFRKPHICLQTFWHKALVGHCPHFSSFMREFFWQSH